MSLKQLGVGAAGIYAAYLTGAILAERLYQYAHYVDTRSNILQPLVRIKPMLLTILA